MCLAQLPEDTYLSYDGSNLSCLYSDLSFGFCLLVDLVLLWVFFHKCTKLKTVIYIGIKHGFSYINIRQVSWEVLKTEAEGRGFQHLPRDLANVNTLKNHVRSLLLHKK